MVLYPADFAMNVDCHKNIRPKVTEFVTWELDIILKIVLSLLISIIIKVIPGHYGNGEIKYKAFYAFMKKQQRRFKGSLLPFSSQLFVLLSHLKTK
jgi:hypothetical protein